MTDKRLLQRCGAELIGSFGLVFFGCGAAALQANGVLPSMAVPFAFGLVVTVMVYTLGHVSGAHLNPAVSFAFVITRHFPFREACVYTLVQVFGGILAVAALTILLPNMPSYGATIPLVSSAQALLWEFLLSYFLMLVIMAVATDTRAVGIMAGAAIGAMVMLGALVGGWASGASMNPVRSIAPALVQGDLSHL